MKILNKLMRKILIFLIVIIGITFFSFILTYLSPSDPAEMLYQSQGVTPTDAELAATRTRMGLDRPLWVQYGSWICNLLRGDMGTSLKSGKPVIDEMLRVMPNTLRLTALAMLLTIGISLPVGACCARWKDHFFDRVIRAVTYLFASIPSFFLSLLLMYILAVRLHFLPVISAGQKAGIVLPVMVLALNLSCWFIRQVRSIVLRELNQGYVDGLRSRGMTEHRILFRHVLKNAMMPILTLISMSFGSLMGGSTIVENIFTWQGLGNLAVNSISYRDYPVIQGYVLWMAVIFLMIHTLVDISYYWIDPRVRKGSEDRGMNQ